MIGFHTFQPGLLDDSCEYNQYIAESVFTQGSFAYEVKEIICQYENVTVEVLDRICIALNCNIEDIIEVKDNSEVSI